MNEWTERKRTNEIRTQHSSAAEIYFCQFLTLFPFRSFAFLRFVSPVVRAITVLRGRHRCCYFLHFFFLFFYFFSLVLYFSPPEIDDRFSNKRLASNRIGKCFSRLFSCGVRAQARARTHFYSHLLRFLLFVPVHCVALFSPIFAIGRCSRARARLALHHADDEWKSNKSWCSAHKIQNTDWPRRTTSASNHGCYYIVDDSNTYQNKQKAREGESEA